MESGQSALRVDTPKWQARGARAGLVLLFVGAMALQLRATKWGIGLSPDSASYIAGAIGIGRGKGFSFPAGGGTWQPTAKWPPLYSVTLAVPIFLGADPLQSARWLNAILLGATTVVLALLLQRITGIHPLLPVLGATLLLLNRDTVSTYSWAWSDGLFIFLFLLAMLFLDRYLRGERMRDLIISGVIVGMAWLTRYSGAALFLGGLVAVAAFPGKPGSSRSRFRDAVVFAGIACTPFLVWSMRNWIVTGWISGAAVNGKVVSGDEWHGVYRILYLWFMPGRIGEPARSYVMALVLLFLLGTGFLLARLMLSRDEGASASARLGFLAFSLAVAYGLVVWISRVFARFFAFDDPRQVLPLNPLLIVVFFSLGMVLLSKPAPDRTLGAAADPFRRLLPGLQFLLMGYLVMMLGSHSLHTSQWLLQSRSKGLGYANDSWRTSKLVETVRSLPPGTPVFSNAYDALYLLTDREVYPLPDEPRGDAQSGSGNLPSDWGPLVEMLRDRGGVIAYFDQHTRSGMVGEMDLLGALPLCADFEAVEGRVYRLCK